VLEFIEEAFDEVAFAVERKIARSRGFAVGKGGLALAVGYIKRAVRNWWDSQTWKMISLGSFFTRNSRPKQ
jgi:hypothetical protein